MAPPSVTWKLLILDLPIKEEIVDYLNIIRYSAKCKSEFYPDKML